MKRLAVAGVVVVLILLSVIFYFSGRGTAEVGYTMDLGQKLSTVELDQNKEFLKKNPQALPFLTSLQKTLIAMKDKQAKGFKMTAVSQEERTIKENPTKIVIYSQGNCERVEMERNGKKMTLINTEKTQVTIDEQGSVKKLPKNYANAIENALVLASWYSDSLKWISFTPASDKKNGFIEGATSDGFIHLEFLKQDPDKIVGIKAWMRDGSKMNHQTLSDHVRVDGLWLAQKIVSKHQMSKGTLVRNLTIESINFNWRPNPDTFAASPSIKNVTH